MPILGEPGADSGGEGKSKRVKNMARRKVKNGEKSPWGQRLTRPVPNGRRRSGFWLVPENFCVFLPNQKAERRRPFGTGLVRHCPQRLFSPFFTFIRAIFSRPFRLSLAPSICPWVSEDEKCPDSCLRGLRKSLRELMSKLLFSADYLAGLLRYLKEQSLAHQKFVWVLNISRNGYKRLSMNRLASV